MKGTGNRLAQAGYAVFGIDYEGHGKSDSKRCYIESFQDLVDDSIAFSKSVRGIYSCSRDSLIANMISWVSQWATVGGTWRPAQLVGSRV